MNAPKPPHPHARVIRQHKWEREAEYAQAHGISVDKLLTPRQKRFVQEYLVDMSAGAAALRAGYKIRQSGYELMKRPAVWQAIAEAERTKAEAIGLQATRVLEEVRRIALADPRDYFYDDGTPKPLSALTEAQAAAVAGLEVIVKNAEGGDGHTDRVLKLRTWDKTKALELLMKYLGLFEESGRVQGTIELVWGGQPTVVAMMPAPITPTAGASPRRQLTAAETDEP